MTKGFYPLRLLALIAFSALLFAVDQAAVAAPQVKPVYIELPEITTALNHDYQVIVQVTLRLSGPLAEQPVKDNIPKLRHALVLHLSDINVHGLDAQAVDALADSYALAANTTLDSKNAVKAAFFQQFVIQTK